MKARMLSNQNATYLFDHLLDGFKATHQGIEKLKEERIIDDAEFTELLEKNSERLIARIREFKASLNITCWVFAVMFTMLQVQGEDIDMRKPTRGGRRRENEVTRTI